MDAQDPAVKWFLGLLSDGTLPMLAIAILIGMGLTIARGVRRAANGKFVPYVDPVEAADRQLLADIRAGRVEIIYPVDEEKPKRKNSFMLGDDGELIEVFEDEE